MRLVEQSYEGEAEGWGKVPLTGNERPRGQQRGSEDKGNTQQHQNVTVPSPLLVNFLGMQTGMWGCVGDRHLMSRESLFEGGGIWAGKTPANAGWLLIPSAAGHTSRSYELTPRPQAQPVSESESFPKPPLPEPGAGFPQQPCHPVLSPLTVQAHGISSQRLLSFKPRCRRPGQPPLANCDRSISTSSTSFLIRDEG